MMILEGPPSLVGSVAFTADSMLLAAGTQDGQARVWDAAGSLVFQRELPHPGSKCLVAFPPQGDLLAVSSETHVSLFPLDGGETVSLHHRTPGVTTDLGFVTSELLVVATGKRAGTSAGGYYIYDLARNTIRTPVHSESHGIRALASQASTKVLAWVTGNNLLRWANIAKPGFQEMRLGLPGSAVALAGVGPLLAVGADWKARLIDMPSRTERRSLSAHKGQVVAAAFHPHAPRLATGSWDETVRVWDVGSGAELHCFHWSIGKILCLAYSPDGTRMAAGTDRGLVAVWDVE